MRVLAMRRISAVWTDRAEKVSDFAPAVFQGWDQGWELAPDVAGLARAAAAAACATTERGRMRRANDQRSAARQQESQTKQKRSATTSRAGVKAIEVAGRILDLLARAEQPIALRDLAAAGQMSSGKAHRYLASFIASGLARQDPCSPAMVKCALSSISTVTRHLNSTLQRVICTLLCR